MKRHPLANCENCPLAKEQGPVLGAGPSSAKMVLLGEAPGREEVVRGRPMVGASGQLLDVLLDSVGVKPDETYRTNVVLCRPAGNATPPAAAVEACRPRLLDEIAAHSEAPLVALGGTAVKVLEAGAPGVLTARGRWRTTDFKRPYFPTVHPAYVLRNEPAVLDMAFDLEKAAQPIPVHVELKPFLHVIYDKYDWERLPWTNGVWVVDVETNAKGELISINVAWGPGAEDTAVMLPGFFDYARVEGLFTKPDITYVMHNGKFDVQALWRNDFLGARCDFDTMLAHYVLDERAPGENEAGQFNKGYHGLKVLAAQYFDAPEYEVEPEKIKKAGIKKKVPDFGTIPIDKLVLYGSYDAHYTFRLYEIFDKRLKEEGLYEWPFKNVLMASSQAFSESEYRGVQIDRPLLDKLAVQWGSHLEVLHEEMETIVGHEFNVRSFPQMSAIFYDELKLPPPPVRGAGGDRKGSARSTDSTALMLLQDRHPLVPKLQMYRRMDKMLGTYVDGITARLDANGALHTSTFLHGTVTGRISTRDPSLMNIPRANEKEIGHFGKQVKDLFVARPGMMLVLADIAQAELRVAAAMSGDPYLLNAFRTGKDIHSAVAEGVFGAGWGEEERYVAKAINFGFVYGGGKNVLVQRVTDLRGFRPDMKADKTAIGKIIDDYMQLLSTLAEWRVTQLQHLKDFGWVATRSGRRRRFPLITDNNADEARKACVNAPCQGTASDINLLAFIRMTKEGFRTLLSVHDSILLEVPEAEVESASKYAVQCLIEAGNSLVPEVPWEADVKVGPSWGSLHKPK